MGRKTHNHRLDVPPLELECMNALWNKGEATVGQVRAGLAPTRQLAYTTVLTLLDRLHRKGLAERAKKGRLFYYRPVVTRNEVLDRLLNRMTQAFFKGSRQDLIRYLAGQAEVALSFDAALVPEEPGSEAPPQPELGLHPGDTPIDTSLL